MDTKEIEYLRYLWYCSLLSNEPVGSIRCREYLRYLQYCLLLRKVSAACTYLCTYFLLALM